MVHSRAVSGKSQLKLLVRKLRAKIKVKNVILGGQIQSGILTRQPDREIQL